MVNAVDVLVINIKILILKLERESEIRLYHFVHSLVIFLKN